MVVPRQRGRHAPWPLSTLAGGAWPDLSVILGLAALAVVKFWPLLRPTDREFRSTDQMLGIEGFFYDLLKRGILYLWDPTVITGNLTLGGGVHHPGYIPAHFHLFYPLNILFFGALERNHFIPHISLVWFLVFHYFLAGVFTYLYGRALKLGRFGSLVAALTYMFSTTLMAHFEHWILIATVAWLPLIAYCLKQAMEKGSWGWGAATGIPLAMSFLAGHPQGFFYLLFGTVLYWGFLCWQTTSAAGLRGRPLVGALARRVGLLGLSGAFAVALAAIQLLPTVGLGVTAHQVELSFDWKAQGSLSPAHLLQFLLPSGLTFLSDWLSIASEVQLYVGILPLILAGLGLAAGETAAFYAGLGLVALLLAFGGEFPLFRIVYDLVPGFSAFRIPARILVLLAFALAVLAGYGAKLIGGPPQDGARGALGRAARVVGRLTLVAIAVGLALGLALLSAAGQSPLVEMLTFVFKQYVIFVLLLVLALGVLVVRLAWGPRPAVQALALGVIVLDLVFWGFPVGGHKEDPDRALTANQDLVAFLERDRALFRLGVGDTAVIPALELYRHRWPVYNEGNRFAPPRVLDLYFRIEKNPRLLDLMNVKYILGKAPYERPTKYTSLDVSPDLPVKILPLELARPVSELRLISHVANGRELREGTELAVLSLSAPTGTRAFRIRAGIETAEWAHDAPGFSRPPHARPPIAESWTVEDKGYQGHYYLAVWRLNPPVTPTALTLRYTHPAGVVLIKHLYADGTDLAALPNRFRQVHRQVYENRYVLPRAFLVPRARVLPPGQVLKELERFDPEQEVLLSEVPAAVRVESKPAPLGPGERVEVLDYRFDRIRLRAEVERSRFLVLSETWSPWWRAWDNGAETPILRADHALRAVWLTPGKHEIEFRFSYPPFFVGVVLTLLGWTVLAGWGILALRARRAAT